MFLSLFFSPSHLRFLCLLFFISGVCQSKLACKDRCFFEDSSWTPNPNITLQWVTHPSVFVLQTRTIPQIVWLVQYCISKWLNLLIIIIYYYIYMYHCKKKKKKKRLGKLKILSQPGSADFWVFSTYFLGNFSTFCCINLKQEVEKTQKSAEDGCLKILNLPTFFFLQ